MTEEQKKKSGIAGVTFRAITALYFVAAVFWLSLPLLIAAYLAPEIFGFLVNIGQEGAEKNRKIVTSSGYILAAINAGFLIWHFLIKRHTSNVFKNRIFKYWVSITNVVLICWLAGTTFGPVH